MKRSVLFLLLASAAAFAQVIPPAQPDCFIQLFNVTATGAGASFDNRGLNCVDWTVTVQFRGFTGASVELDSAPDANGTPGTFAVFSGTVVNGTNPVTVYTQNSANFAVSGFFPWTRLNITSLTGSGSINVVAAGFRPIAFNTIKGLNISQIGGINVFACAGTGQTAQALFNLTSSGNTQIIPLSGTLRTLICHIDLAMASAVDFKITQGTGANCAVATADVTGLSKNIVTFVQDYGPFAPLVIASGDAACANISANVVGGGIVIFTQQP